MSVTAIIQARMNSSRLPGKQLISVAGVPLLKRVIDRVTEASLVDLVVVATCVRGAEPIVGHCSEWEIPCFVSAKEHDVLGRFVEVCRSLDLGASDLVVRVCGDNPLIRPDCIDQLINEARRTDSDYTAYAIDDTPAILRPTGYFAEAVLASAITAAHCRLDDDDPTREHVTQTMYTSPDLYRCHFLDPPDWYLPGQTIDTAIDTIEDLQRVEELLTNGVPA